MLSRQGELPKVGVSPSGAAFHWNKNAETFFLIGNGMGEAMKSLIKDK